MAYMIMSIKYWFHMFTKYLYKPTSILIGFTPFELYPYDLSEVPSEILYPHFYNTDVRTIKYLNSRYRIVSVTFCARNECRSDGVTCLTNYSMEIDIRNRKSFSYTARLAFKSITRDNSINRQDAMRFSLLSHS